MQDYFAFGETKVNKNRKAPPRENHAKKGGVRVKRLQSGKTKTKLEQSKKRARTLFGLGEEKGVKGWFEGASVKAPQYDRNWNEGEGGVSGREKKGGWKENREI